MYLYEIPRFYCLQRLYFYRVIYTRDERERDIYLRVSFIIHVILLDNKPLGGECIVAMWSGHRVTESIDSTNLFALSRTRLIDF